MKYQQWKIAQRSQQVCREMERQGVPLLVAATLCARGLTDLDEAKALLSSAEDQLCDPYLMKDMDLATARIGRALRNKESIAVYGDYDVDGITATCLLTHYLRSQGGNVRYYIPDRLTEGYGVNNQAVEELALQGVTLIITVDCGITALAETAYAASLGVDMIVTDHHECKEKLPDAIAVVDPHRKDCPYPFKDLAGVGVALKLVMALGSVSGGEKRANALFHEYADLAAVGTIADVMKLLGENRTIVRVGLKHLKKTRRRGLYALMVEAGTLSRAINSTTVGYCLSPRITAAGRMGRAAMAADLILTDDTERAEYLAHELCELNRQRQGVELDIFNNCLSRLAGGGTYDCLVLADHTWHQGVVGIVASRLAEQFACPVFMICLQEDGKGKGSCRSYGGFNLFAALEQCADLLEGYGGHALTCMTDVGGGRHLKMRASRDGRTVDMIFFSVTRAKSGLAVGDKADVAFYPQINEYRGSRTVQLHLVDLRPAYTAKQQNEQALYRKYSRGEPITPCEARAMIPDREELAAVWRYLANREGEVIDHPIRLARKVAQEGDLWESTLRTMICLEVMESFELLHMEPEPGGMLRICLQKRRGQGKVSLLQSPIIKHLQDIAWGKERSS